MFDFFGRLKKYFQWGFFQTIRGKITGKSERCFNQSKYYPIQFVFKFLTDYNADLHAVLVFKPLYINMY